MEDFNKIAQIIKQTDAILITAGAGIGVDSGLPDFRGKEGFWKSYPALEKHNIKFEQMANPRWFDEKPLMAWAFYGHRYNLYKETQPHKGFEIIKSWCKLKNDNFFVVTSNVDGHFQKAGFPNNRILEVHGSINYWQCTKPCNDNIWQANFEKIEIDDDKFEAIEPIPICPHCGAIARPNILMFGDWTWISNRTNIQEDNFGKWLKLNIEKNIVIIEIGAGTSVPTIRLTSEDIAQNYNATLIRINPRDFWVPKEHYSLSLNALEAIERINEFVLL